MSDALDALDAPEPNALLVEDDSGEAAFLRQVLRDAVLPPLLPALAFATGDMSILTEEVRPDGRGFLLPDGGLSPEQQERIRDIAFDTICDLEKGDPVKPTLDDDDLLEIMEFLVGGSDMGDYIPIFKSELGLPEKAPWGDKVGLSDLADARGFRVAVIGAGMSGLLAGHHLGRAGIRFIIYEKNDSVGGTWFENTYPGCRVDVPNHYYSYSFAQGWKWSQHYSKQSELQAYFSWFADKAGVTPFIQFGATVDHLVWVDQDKKWKMETRGQDGSTSSEMFDVVISAVGQLNNPNIPVFEGSGSFEGAEFHSAKWNHDVRIAGKKVAVIGTGASACQLIPPVAAEVDELLVFQRTPPWFVPTPDYQHEISDGLRWLFENVPYYDAWHRCWWFWRTGDAVLPTAQIDPDWEHEDGSISEMNQAAMHAFTRYIEKQCKGRPDLLEKCLPKYPVAAKRGLRDDGSWFSALRRENVSVVSDPISELRPEGIKTSDGKVHEVDVIIYGTGFTASDFLKSIRVTGLDGTDLHEAWSGNARAFKGVAVPGFPNLFMLYGPNTNVVVNSSIILQSECEANLIMSLIALLLEEDAASVECEQGAYDAFNEMVAAENKRMAWSLDGVHNWYKNKFGRVTQNWPFSTLAFWEMTRGPQSGEFMIVGRDVAGT